MYVIFKGTSTSSWSAASGELVKKYIANSMVLAVVSFPANKRLMMKSAIASSWRLPSSTSLLTKPPPLVSPCLVSAIILLIFPVIFFLACKLNIVYSDTYQNCQHYLCIT